MSILRYLSDDSWRRTGTLNVTLIFSASVLLLSLLLANIYVGPVRSIWQSRIMFEGDCGKARRLTVALHLLINVFGSCIIASSNFFMQVLSSPSRVEIDRAHRRLFALEIGVPSIKNMFFLSRFKLLLWVALFLTSVPIHLIFNSVVFETNFEGYSWNLTLATEAFVDGTGAYFAPGASLAPSGTYNPNQTSPSMLSFYGDYNGWSNSLYGGSTYGDTVALEDYWNGSSAINRSISETAKNASTWHRLTPKECYSEYSFCKPRKQYRDVVVVLKAGDDLQGWKRSDMFDFDPATNLSLVYDAHIPPDTPNSLWYSAQCDISRDSYDLANYCDGSCSGALGVLGGIAWANTTELSGSEWTISFYPSYYSAPASYGFNETVMEKGLEVSHCLAKPAADYRCKVGASNDLLLTVIVCTFAKVFLCTIILWKLPHDSLITPGDAIESFISTPDPKTAVLGAIDASDSHRIEHKKLLYSSAMDLKQGPRPRRWRSPRRVFKHIITAPIWLRTYAILGAGLVLLITPVSIIAVDYGSSSLTESFGSSDTTRSANIFHSQPSYTGILLTANAPQLILSFCYFSFNAFFTRIATEQEWNSYSRSYKPLRVTSPKDGQISTYRLQLPYRWSIPLLATSMLLHWMMSNAIFVFIVEGGFMRGSSGGQASFSYVDFGVSEDALVALGFSGSALLAMLVIATVLSSLPIIFSHLRVSGDMVSGGSNSLVLSAACHASVLARGPGKPDASLSSLDAAAKAGSKLSWSRYASSLGLSRKRRAESPDEGEQTPSIMTDDGRYYHSVDLQEPQSMIPATLPRGHDREPLLPATRTANAKDISSVDTHQMEAEERRQPTNDQSTTEALPGAADRAEPLLSAMPAEEREGYELRLLRELSRKKLKWGAMALDPYVETSLIHDSDEPVMHLGFGSEEDDVQPPQEGHWYF